MFNIYRSLIPRSNLFMTSSVISPRAFFHYYGSAGPRPSAASAGDQFLLAPSLRASARGRGWFHREQWRRRHLQTSTCSALAVWESLSFLGTFPTHPSSGEGVSARPAA